MKGYPPFNKEYFERFSTDPVQVKPFDPYSKIIAKEYIDIIKKLLKKYDLEIIHRGSTAFEISGKGDIEIGVFPKVSDWKDILKTLENYFQKHPDNKDINYARFNDYYKDFEIEVICMKEFDAYLERKLFNFLSTHPELLKQYEEVKKKFCYDGRVYQMNKDRFFRRIISQIPED